MSKKKMIVSIDFHLEVSKHIGWLIEECLTRLWPKRSPDCRDTSQPKPKTYIQYFHILDQYLQQFEKDCNEVHVDLDLGVD